jgi:lipopolysaccharide export system permease protein
MMVLAPFAYVNVREGGVSSRSSRASCWGSDFTCSIGCSDVGLLAAWPPVLAAFVPTVTFLAVAILMIWRLERR